jgi:hypothetical protein
MPLPAAYFASAGASPPGRLVPEIPDATYQAGARGWLVAMKVSACYGGYGAVSCGNFACCAALL